MPAKVSREDVFRLMESSGNLAEWNMNCDIVQRWLGGYPDYWLEVVEHVRKVVEARKEAGRMNTKEPSGK